MECSQALDTMRMKLEATFGKALAMMIIASSANAANVSTVALSSDEFRRLADSVCNDKRVIDMWGAAAAQDTAGQWKQLVA